MPLTAEERPVVGMITAAAHAQPRLQRRTAHAAALRRRRSKAVCMSASRKLVANARGTAKPTDIAAGVARLDPSVQELRLQQHHHLAWQDHDPTLGYSKGASNKQVKYSLLE